MKKISIATIFFCLALIASQLVSSCKKSKNDPEAETTPIVTSPASKIYGVVKDENGLPIDGVSITNGNNTITSNSNGYFEINGVAASDGRCAVSAKKDGYFSGAKRLLV